MTVVLLLALSAATAAAEGRMRLGEFIPVTPPQPAPEASFADLGGNPTSLAAFKGTPTIVNLWATWCQPCLREMPSLDRLQAEFDGKLAVAAVSQDHAGGKRVKPFVAAMKLKSLKIYLDPEAHLEHAFHARGLPTSIVLDAKGRVVGKVEGAADWTSPAMKAAIEPLLAGGGAPLEHALNGSRR